MLPSQFEFAHPTLIMQVLDDFWRWGAQPLLKWERILLALVQLPGDLSHFGKYLERNPLSVGENVE